MPDHSTTPVSRHNAEHYSWGDGCDGWHLVRTGALSVIEERMPPGTRETRHRHLHARQLFYVLAGELTMETDGVTHRLPARTALEIAPGVAHQASNEGRVDAEFLVCSVPPSHTDRVVAPADTVS